MILNAKSFFYKAKCPKHIIHYFNLWIWISARNNFLDCIHASDILHWLYGILIGKCHIMAVLYIEHCHKFWLQNFQMVYWVWDYISKNHINKWFATFTWMVIFIVIFCWINNSHLHIPYDRYYDSMEFQWYLCPS